MKKKIIFDYVGYDEYLYTGIQGFFMRKNHEILSKRIPSICNKVILEIGGGAKPHCSLVKLNGVEEYWISDSPRVLDGKCELSHHNLKKHYYNDDPNFKNFKKSGKLFTRIIASHVLEHVHNPEETLLKWVDLLSDDGVLDIAIPCDPGYAWRLGQLFGRKKAKKLYNLSSADIDLLMTREHINSCQNLITIIKSYTNKRGRYFPLFIPIVDVNLFVIFRLYKSDFIRTTDL
jgi:phosphatidylethanolamine/phosphatidyl-N-methylethanolamine N-methyltransferase